MSQVLSQAPLVDARRPGGVGWTYCVVLLLAWALPALLLAGCEADPLPTGAACSDDTDCTSGFCSGDAGRKQPFVCSPPSQDVDADGLSERDERRLGLDPTLPDTDGDQVPDAVEVGPDLLRPVDRDGDGRIDALESGLMDADQDCLRDPVDPHDLQVAGAAELAAIACTSGVCAGQATGATCQTATGAIACEVAGGKAFEGTAEVTCDGLDNDCDGQTDEELAGKAGAFCGSQGVCAGAKTSTCEGGKWLCNLGHLATYQTVETTCDGLDNDCDGKTDNGPVCEDGVGCTVDECLGAIGCRHLEDGKLCSDGNPCTAESCDVVLGCRSVPKIGACDDGLLCTKGESCQGAVCKGGHAVVCDDGNQCTLDHCDPLQGCVAKPLIAGAACKPSAACAQAGTCNQGVCEATTQVGCDDGNDCTSDACDPVSGSCAHLAIVGPCNDGNPCTAKDACAGPVCAGQPLSTCCKNDGDCADASPCTADTCNAGQCSNDIFAANGKPCEDGNACTKGESCSFGACAATSTEKCSDANPCTLDICDPTSGCQHTQLSDGVSCDDGDVCNGSDVCQGGACVLGGKLTCGDSNPCTIDTCDKVKGCQFTLTSGGCDDVNPCTTKDSCSSGSCIGAPLKCDDKNPCTSDSCDLSQGCVYAPIAAPCSDGNACTGQDACKGGQCLGSAVSCDDGDSCTVDTCSGVAGCQHDASISEGKACSDGSACTLGDVCAGGTCTSGAGISCDDQNPCTDDKCDPVSGVCKHAFNTQPCTSPSACAVDPVCKQGVCKAKTELSGCCSFNGDCDDGNPCTIDSCTKPAKVCSHLLVDGLACDDGSKCSVGDLCVQGACTPGAALGCDDGKPCTADWCASDSGCQHLALASGPCSDGNPCNGLETCSAQGCDPGTPPVCDDGNPCTLDGCDATGCTHAFLQPGTACTDGSACTASDACDGTGSCKGTPKSGPECCTQAADCNDGWPCTTDACTTATAQCSHLPLACGSDGGCQVGFCGDGACTTQPACAKPLVYAEGFEGSVPGWLVTASETGSKPGLDWKPLIDTDAVEGTRTLHVGYGSGTYTALLPPLGLQPGTYLLRLQARLDVDGQDCAKGALQVYHGDEALGPPLCLPSASLAPIEHVLTLTAADKLKRISVVFQAATPTPDAQRGAWLDAVQVLAQPTAPCSCD